MKISTEFIEEMKQEAKESENGQFIIEWGESEPEIRELIDEVFADHVIQISGQKNAGKTDSACGIHVVKIESIDELANVADIWSKIFEELAEEIRGVKK